MTTAIKSAISPFAQSKTEPKANAILFLDEQLASMPASGIPEDFSKLSQQIQSGHSWPPFKLAALSD